MNFRIPPKIQKIKMINKLSTLPRLRSVQCRTHARCLTQREQRERPLSGPWNVEVKRGAGRERFSNDRRRCWVVYCIFVNEPPSRSQRRPCAGLCYIIIYIQSETRDAVFFLLLFFFFFLLFWLLFFSKIIQWMTTNSINMYFSAVS